MWYAIILIGLPYVCWRFFAKKKDLLAAGVMAVSAFALVLCMSPFVLGLSSGFVWNKVPRQLSGYVVTLDEYDFVGPTFELTVDTAAPSWGKVQEQLETGEDSYAFMRLSISDSGLVQKVQPLVGQKVTLTYRQWVIQPFDKGLTSFEVLDISKSE